MRAFNVSWAFAVLTWGLFIAGAQAQSGTATNVALDCAAYQSSAINYDNVAHLATDGSLDSFWQSKPEAQPWIYVDLGRSQKVYTAGQLSAARPQRVRLPEGFVHTFAIDQDQPDQRSHVSGMGQSEGQTIRASRLKLMDCRKINLANVA